VVQAEGGAEERQQVWEAGPWQHGTAMSCLPRRLCGCARVCVLRNELRRRSDGKTGRQVRKACVARDLPLLLQPGGS